MCFPSGGITMVNLHIVLFVCQFPCFYCVEDWNLPVFPVVPPPIQFGTNVTDDLKVPRHIWIAVSFKEDLGYLTPVSAKNPRWEGHLYSNEMRDEFMNNTFAGTSYLWAYNMIDSCAKDAKTHLWKYAVLWAYGGTFIDDGSEIGTPLNSLVEPEDTLIISCEKKGHYNSNFNANRCYIPTYKLSDFMAYKNESNRDLNIFHQRHLVDWAMIAAPRHEMIEQTMKNAVEIIRYEYHQENVTRPQNWVPRVSVACTTGGSLLTASLREAILGGVSNATYRLVDDDFQEYGGHIRTVKSRRIHISYVYNVCPNLLSDYLPEKPVSAEQLKAWQGLAIRGYENVHDVFIVDNLKKRRIPNYDTFQALNYTFPQVIVLNDSKIASIETGLPMPSLMKVLSSRVSKKKKGLFY